MAETPSVRNRAQAGENKRKNSFLNYKSAALFGEATWRTFGFPYDTLPIAFGVSFQYVSNFRRRLVGNWIMQKLSRP